MAFRAQIVERKTSKRILKWIFEAQRVIVHKNFTK